MNIGVLCEGALTDKPVLEILLRGMFPDVDFLIRAGTKATIFKNGDWELSALFDHAKVERALILWDLLPLELQGGVKSQLSAKACRSEQRRMLLELLCNSRQLPQYLHHQSLAMAERYSFRPSQEVPLQKTSREDLFTLVCVCYELDAWLLSDPEILCGLASTASHTVKRLRFHPGEPDKCQDPTAALKHIFSEAPNKRFRYYAKHTHNALIAQEYVKQNKVDTIYKSSESFKRVVRSIEKWIQK